MVDGNNRLSNNKPRQGRGNYFIDQADEFQNNQPSRNPYSNLSSNRHSGNYYQDTANDKLDGQYQQQTGGNYYYRGNQPNSQQVDHWEHRMASQSHPYSTQFQPRRAQRNDRAVYRKVASYSLKKDLIAWPKGKLAILSVYIILFIMMIWAGHQILPFDRVNDVQVTGNQWVSRDAIVALSGILPTDKTADVLKQKNKIEDVIKEELPMVDKVHFDDSNWHHLVIHVDENRIVGRLLDSAYLLSNGDAIEINDGQQINDQIGNLPLVEANNQKQLLGIVEFLNQMNDVELSRIRAITNHPERNYVVDLQMNDGNEVRGTTETLYQKMQYYNQMVQATNGQTGLFNLEVGAYFTPHQSPNNSVKLDNNIGNR